jgi:predicted HTH domain antitoxin
MNCDHLAAGEQLRRAAVRYSQGLISQGKAAEIAGLSRTDFLGGKPGRK